MPPAAPACYAAVTTAPEIRAAWPSTMECWRGRRAARLRGSCRRKPPARLKRGHEEKDLLLRVKYLKAARLVLYRYISWLSTV